MNIHEFLPPPSEMSRREGPHNAFRSRDGLLYVAGSMNDFKAFRLDNETHLFKEALPRERRDWHYGNDTAGCITEADGYLYYCGQGRWGRYHFADGREDLLITNPRRLNRETRFSHVPAWLCV